MPLLKFKNAGEPTKQFKELRSASKKGLTDLQLRQAYVFYRTDIFLYQQGGSTDEPDVQTGLSRLTRPQWTAGNKLSQRAKQVVNYYNYKKPGDHPNISIMDDFIDNQPDVADFIDRKKYYSRAAFNKTGKTNWRKTSNNFILYKHFEIYEGDSLKSYNNEFPKSIQNNDNNTIAAITGLEISFDGTNPDTAKSDVVVKINFTMDSFKILDIFYKLSDSGNKWVPFEPGSAISRAKKEGIRLLDLLTPPDLDEGDGFFKRSLLLELYADDENAKSSYRKYNPDRPLVFQNQLTLQLYIEDHTLTFNETTNKVDVEVQYRAAIDQEILEKDPYRTNVLYSSTNKEELRKRMDQWRVAMNSGCYDKAADINSSIQSEVRKYSLDERIRNMEQAFPRYLTKNYPNRKASKRSTYGGNEYEETANSVESKRAGSIHDELKGNNVDFLDDYYTSLQSLLISFCDDSRVLTLLPIIPLYVGEGLNFYTWNLGDLPINLNCFDKWFTKRYINENQYFLDFKTFLKDVITLYVNPHLRIAFDNRKIELSVSTKHIAGSVSNPNNLNQLNSGNVHEFKLKLDNDENAKDYIINTVHIQTTYGDFKPTHLGDKYSVGSILRDISDRYIVIEAKSPYGPFKNLEMSKTDSEYIREIRAVDQNISSIAQLGAVYDCTMETHVNCPDFRFFPGEICFLYIPDFGLSTRKDNLAYKLGIGGNQIITKVTHKIDLVGTTKMSTTITMRYWGSGTTQSFKNIGDAEKCPAVLAKEAEPNYDVWTPFGTIQGEDLPQDSILREMQDRQDRRNKEQEEQAKREKNKFT